MSVQEYLEQKVNPLLEEMVELLLKDRPEDPIPTLLEFLNSKSQTVSATDGGMNKLLAALRSQTWMSEEDDDGLLSPLSTGILSPSHSPSNVQKYWAKGARFSISGTVTDDVIKQIAASSPNVISDAQLTRLLPLLRQTQCAKGRSEEELVEMAKNFTENVVSEADSVVDIQADIFIVESGKLEEIETEEEFQRLNLPIYGPGDLIGSPAILYGVSEMEQVVVKTVTECTVFWRLPREQLEYLTRASAMLKRDDILHFLSSVPILSSMDIEDIAKVCDALKEESFESGEVIVSQGEMGSRFYIVVSGECHATKSYVPGQVPRRVMVYKKGDYFGELSLLHNEPRAATVTAHTNVSVVSIDRRSFKRLLGPIEDILLRNSSTYVGEEPAGGVVVNHGDVL